MHTARLVMTLIALCVASASHARELPAQVSTSGGRLCLSPRPIDRCRSFWITEVGITAGLSSPPYTSEGHVMWEIGLMRNRGPRSALGGAVLVGGSDDAIRLAVKARYRRWLTARTPIDLAPGILILGSNYDMEAREVLGFTGHVGVSYADLLGAFLQLELTKGVGGGTEMGTYVGARMGGLLGAIAGVGLMVAIAVLGSQG